MKYLKEKITTINNQDIFKIKITNDNNYSIEFFNFGGYIHSIYIPYKDEISKTEDVVLGYKNFQDYQDDEYYINALVGRVCGRIAKSKFILNDKIYNLFPNDSSHHIHGGKKGFNKKIWKIELLQNIDNILVCKLIYKSIDMEEQYPGTLNCSATYKLNNKNEFEITYEASSDRDTIVNITNHNYWNFHGHNKFYQNIEDHYLKIQSNYVCEVDRNQIPSGKLINVDNTKYDLRNIRKIDQSLLNDDGIDHCYQIDTQKKTTEVASIYSNHTKMGMIFSTDQPGLQLYTGNMMANIYPGKFDREYGYQYGICLEAQLYPDAINQPNFISPILKARETYSSKIIMKFKNDF